MTPSEPVDRHNDDDSRSMLWAVVRALVFGLLAVMALGALVGFLASMAEHGWKLLPQYVFEPESGLWRHRDRPPGRPAALQRPASADSRHPRRRAGAACRDPDAPVARNPAFKARVFETRETPLSNLA